MSQEKESSVLFSVKELMNLEADRIKAEEAAKAAQLAEAERLRMEAERAAIEAEQARVRADEERRRQEEQRAREEAARLEAMRQAEVEKARVEAENRARLEAAAQQQQHERSLAELQQDKSKKRLRNSLIGLVAGGLLLAGGATFVAKQYHERKEAELAQTHRDQEAAEEAKRKAEEATRKLEEELKASQEKIEQLTSRLASASTEGEKAAILKEIDAEKGRQDALRKAPAGGGGAATRPAARPSAPASRPAGVGSKSACKCAPGDPLCSCD